MSRGTRTANNAAATQLVKLVINRLDKFVAPKVHKLTQKADRVQLSQGDNCCAFHPQARKNEQGFNGVASLIGS